MQRAPPLIVPTLESRCGGPLSTGSGPALTTHAAGALMIGRKVTAQECPKRK